MSSSENWFERAVTESWSQAVMEASARLSEVRGQVVAALDSSNAEVRSAAIAALNDANDKSAHDLVVQLANDPDSHVRSEVLEYIEEFPQSGDAGLLLHCLNTGENLYLATSALRKIFGNVGPLVDEEEVNGQAIAIEAWEEVVRANRRDA